MQRLSFIALIVCVILAVLIPLGSLITRHCVQPTAARVRPPSKSSRRDVSDSQSPEARTRASVAAAEELAELIRNPPKGSRLSRHPIREDDFQKLVGQLTATEAEQLARHFGNSAERWPGGFADVFDPDGERLIIHGMPFLENPPPSERSVHVRTVSECLRIWAQSDPQGALAFIEDLRSSDLPLSKSMNCVSRGLIGASVSDPELAWRTRLDWVTTESDGDLRQPVREVTDHVLLRALMEKSPDLAFDLLPHREIFEAWQIHSAYLHALPPAIDRREAKRELDRLLAALESGTGYRSPEPIMISFAAQWAETDPSAAMDWATDNVRSGSDRAWGHPLVFRKWVACDPDNAARWLAENERQLHFRDEVNHGLLAIVNSQPDVIRQFLSNSRNPGAMTSVLTVLATHPARRASITGVSPALGVGRYSEGVGRYAVMGRGWSIDQLEPLVRASSLSSSEREAFFTKARDLARETPSPVTIPGLLPFE